MISSPCEATDEEADAGGHDPGFGTGDGGLKVFGEATVAPKPSERALYHPAAWLRLEGPDALRAGHDLDRVPARVVLEFGVARSPVT
jgi:hypothetical protein